MNLTRLIFLCMWIPLNSLAQDSSIVRDLVIFYEGSDCAIDSNYKYKLNDLVHYMNNESRAQLHIRGHVCCGPDKSLSRKRARRVYRYLIKRGISRHRLSFEGCSNEQPLRFPEKTEEDEALNRRVDFVLRFKQQ